MRRIALGLSVLAVGIAGCGSSSTKTVTIHAATSTASTSSTVPAPLGGSGTVTVTQTATVAPASLPILITQAWSGVKPRLVDFSGDAGNVVTGISWKSWNGSGAVGYGSSGIQNCIPNCAQGKTTMVPTTLSLSAPSNGHFTHIVEQRNGSMLSAGYNTLNWPIGAQ